MGGLKELTVRKRNKGAYMFCLIGRMLLQLLTSAACCSLASGQTTGWSTGFSRSNFCNNHCHFSSTGTQTVQNVQGDETELYFRMFRSHFFLVEQVNYELEQDNSIKIQSIISLGTLMLISGNKLLQANKESTLCLVNNASVSAESIFKT